MPVPDKPPRFCGRKAKWSRTSHADGSREYKTLTHPTPVEGTLEGEDGQAGTAGGLTADAGPQLLRRWRLTVTLPPL